MDSVHEKHYAAVLETCYYFGIKPEWIGDGKEHTWKGSHDDKTIIECKNYTIENVKIDETNGISFYGIYSKSANETDETNYAKWEWNKKKGLTMHIEFCKESCKCPDAITALEFFKISQLVEAEKIETDNLEKALSESLLSKNIYAKDEKEKESREDCDDDDKELQEAIKVSQGLCQKDETKFDGKTKEKEDKDVKKEEKVKDRTDELLTALAVLSQTQLEVAQQIEQKNIEDAIKKSYITLLGSSEQTDTKGIDSEEYELVEVEYYEEMDNIISQEDYIIGCDIIGFDSGWVRDGKKHTWVFNGIEFVDWTIDVDIFPEEKGEKKELVFFGEFLFKDTSLYKAIFWREDLESTKKLEIGKIYKWEWTLENGFEWFDFENEKEE